MAMSSPASLKKKPMSITLKRKPDDGESEDKKSISAGGGSIQLKKKKKEEVLRPAPDLFKDSDSSDEEEMPAEARMRMRNIGRETATSSGPNSFGKTKHGFIDFKKLFEKQLQEDMDKVAGE